MASGTEPVSKDLLTIMIVNGRQISSAYYTRPHLMLQIRRVLFYSIPILHWREERENRRGGAGGVGGGGMGTGGS